jgi:protein transport protein SEC13
LAEIKEYQAYFFLFCCFILFDLMAIYMIRHSGPVWQVAWSHPKFESLLASCSYDKRVCIFKETSKNQWEKIYEYSGHTASGSIFSLILPILLISSHSFSVNSIAWAPHELGPILAVASSDNSISIHTNQGSSSSFSSHPFKLKINGM